MGERFTSPEATLIIDDSGNSAVFITKDKFSLRACYLSDHSPDRRQS
jgi:hypothetical protein